MIIYFGNFLSIHGYTKSMGETLVNQFILESIPVMYASNKKNLLVRFIDMVNLCLKAHKTDIVLIDTFSTRAFYFAIMLGWISHIKGVKYCPVLRGGNLPIRLNVNRFFDSFFKNSYKIIAPSKYLELPFKNIYENVICIPNFIIINNYPFNFRENIKPKLIWVRSFHAIYNPLLVIDMAELLVRDFPDLEIAMVGPDKDGSEGLFRDEIKKRNLKDHFIITGKLEKEKWILLSQSYSLFISSTNFDNHPVSVIEAMALGLPIVSTNVGGVPFLIEDKVNGLLFEKGNAIEFANAVRRLLTDKNLAAKLSIKSRETAILLNWDTVKTLWLTELITDQKWN